MKCICCQKEIFIKPKINVVLNENEEIIKIKKKEYLYELDDFIEYEDILTEDLELRERKISLVLDEKFMIIKSFCEECYISFIKDKIEELVEILTFFKENK